MKTIQEGCLYVMHGDDEHRSHPVFVTEREMKRASGDRQIYGDCPV